MSTKELVLDIEGMTCASCVQKVERALGSVEGVDVAAVNLATRSATVRGEVEEFDPLVAAVASVGYGARPHDDARDPAEEERYYRARLAVAAPLTVMVLLLTFALPDRTVAARLSWVLTTPVVFWAGLPFFRGAWRAAVHGTTTMDTLIALGASAAYGYSVWQVIESDRVGAEPSAYFDTAAVIVTLIIVGKMLEARARATAGDASSALLARAATHATLIESDGERTVPIEALLPGMVVAVRPGEKVPADGVVRAGTSWVDLSLLTGESTPVDVTVGDEVVGTSINGSGRLEVFVTKVGSHSKLAEIVRLVQAAQGSKAPVQLLADRISSVFVPIVLALAATTAIGWIALAGATPGEAVLHATAVLLIACPCALGLATPVAIMAGTGRASALGVLFKGGAVIEESSAADVVLLDKTGTVTRGAMSVVDVVTVNGASDELVLRLAAAAEAGSGHPIARAVIEEAGRRGVEPGDASAYHVEAGVGATATVDGAVVRVGRPVGLPPAMMTMAAERARRGWTVFAVRRDDVPLGLISVADEVRPEAAGAVERLRTMGVEVGMVTGDRTETGEAIASEVGIGDVHAEVLPAGKVAVVQELLDAGRRVAFVGDGLNDAPALAAATVGMAVGSGTDVALAAADVNLLGGTLWGVADALALARRTYRVIQENLFWAFAYNVVMIPLAVAGVLDPMLAAAAMAVSSVTVVLNALRLRRFHSGRTS